MNHWTHRQFPDISSALELPAIKIFLQHSLDARQKEVDIHKLEIQDVNYEPQRHCVILYKCQLAHRYFKKNWEQWFAGQILPSRQAADSISREAFYNPESGILFSPFPYDPSIQELPLAYDKHEMLQRLSLLYPAHQYKIQNLHIHTMAYTPLMRATLSYQIHLLDRKNKAPLVKELIGKMNIFKPSNRVFANYLAVWKEAAGSIPMPEPVGFLMQPQINFQQKITGTRLGALLDHPDIHLLIENTAHLLARLHQLPIPLSNKRAFEQEAKTLFRWSNVLMELRPDLKSRMETLRSKILSDLESLFRIEGIIHADFHHTNLLVKGKEVQLIDMDEITLGDPCLDVGRFLSSLRIPSLRLHGHVDGLQPQREHFLEQYLHYHPRSLNKIRLFESASLFTSAASAFRLQRTKWETEVDLLLEESEKAYAASKKGTPAPVLSDSSVYHPLSKEQKATWAKNEDYIKTLLAPSLFASEGAEIIYCKCREWRPKGDYKRLICKIGLLSPSKKSKDSYALFMHQERTGDSIFQFMEYISSRLALSQAPFFLPPALVYLDEIDALVFRKIPGKTLKHILDTPRMAQAAEFLAIGYAALHRIPVDPQEPALLPLIKQPSIRSTLVLNRYPSTLLYSSSGAHIPFPITIKLGDPLEDAGMAYAKLLSIGLQSNQFNLYKQFAEYFKINYCEITGIRPDELNTYETKGLRKEVSKLLSKNSDQGVAARILDAAEQWIS